MAQSDAFKKYLDAGMAFSQLTRARAEQIVKDLVAAGELQQKQTRAAIDDLVERSRKNAEAVGELVRTEVSTQLSSLGLATQADIARIEAKISSLGATSSTPAAAPAKATVPAATKAPAPVRSAGPAKAPAAKAPAAKAPAAKAPAAKAPVKKAPVKAAPAKATPAKKAAKRG